MEVLAKDKMEVEGENIKSNPLTDNRKESSNLDQEVEIQSVPEATNDPSSGQSKEENDKDLMKEENLNLSQDKVEENQISVQSEGMN